MKKIKKIIRNAIENFILLFHREHYTSKVFCIGYNKTGTTSLGESLRMLGYKHSSFNEKVWLKYYANNEIVKILQYTAKFEALDDLPWLKEDMIPVLDRVFPNSKFIYLTRDEKSWKNSIYNFTYNRTGVYPDVDECFKEYQAHQDFVLDYFKDRPKEQFLVLDITEKKGFKKLANFLGKTTNQDEFPHYNKTFN